MVVMEACCLDASGLTVPAACCCTTALAGIMLFRNKSMEFVNQWIDIIEKDEKVWDQNAFNDLFRQ